MDEEEVWEEVWELAPLQKMADDAKTIVDILKNADYSHGTLTVALSKWIMHIRDTEGPKKAHETISSLHDDLTEHQNYHLGGKPQ